MGSSPLSMLPDAAQGTLQGPRWIIGLAAVTIAGFLLWAHWAEIEQITRTSGQVISVARTQTLQAPDGGVLQELRVKEGDAVKRGQLLALLDRSRVQAAYDESHGKVLALKAALVRLHAEVYDRPLHFGPDFDRRPEFVANQTELYRRRRQALREELSALESSLRIAREELALAAPLVGSGDISRADVLKLQRTVAELLGAITNKRNKYFQDAQAEMTKAEEDLATQQQALNDRAAILEHTELRAPVTGLVKRIRMTTVGGVLRPGDELIEIVPTEDALLVEAKLQPSDVAFIAPGLPCTIKLDAYDFAIYGALEGVVRYVSPDTLAEATPHGEVSYYRVQVAVTANRMQDAAKARAITLQPGLTATVEIRTGKRSVLQYLTKPIVKTLSQSLHER